MKKAILIFAISVFLTACTPSESAIAIAIAQTQEMDELRAAGTQLAEIEQAMTDMPPEEQSPEGEDIVIEDEPKDFSAENYPFCHPNMICEDRFDIPVSSGYMDVIWLETSLEGEILTATFAVAELPESFTINRAFVKEFFTEYTWMIEIDVDGDKETGIGQFIVGTEFAMEIGHTKFDEGEKSGPFEEIFNANLFEIGGDAMVSLAKPELSVNYENKQISLRATVPNISDQAILFMYTSEVKSEDQGTGDWLDDTIILHETGRMKW